MIKYFITKQIEALRALKNKQNIIAILAILVFVVLNAFKITLFNYYIIPSQTPVILEFKFCLSILLVFIIYSIILKIKSRIVFILFYVLQAAYIVANISYYLYFHSYLHILQGFMLFSEGSTAAAHFAAPISYKLLVAIIDLPVFVFVCIKYSNINNTGKKLWFFNSLGVAASLVIIFSLFMWSGKSENSIINLINNRYAGETPIVEQYGTLTNEVTSLLLKGNEKQLISCFKYGKEVSEGQKSSTKPNFIVIQVESMDSNVINQKYNGQYIAPFLHSLSEQNIYYPYTMSYHKGGSTSDSEFSIINSVEPLDAFPALKLSNYSYPNSMIKSFDNNSYQTLAFHGNIGTFFNRDSAFPKMGFQQFYDMNKMNMKDVGWGAPDNDVFNFAANTLENLKTPYFSYIITMTSHGPFTNASNYYNNSNYDDIKDVTVKDYFNSMSYVDQSIKNFVTNIRANNKNTYIFIVGDHTPNINTVLYHQASFTMDNRYFEFVPMLILTPDNKQYTGDKKVASFLDVSPSILNNSGISFDIKSNGQDLINHYVNDDKIPFKGGEYDRETLFNKVKNIS